MIIAEKGDLMFTASAGGLGPFIRWGEQHPGEEPTEWNHVGIVSRRGFIIPCLQPMKWEHGNFATVIESLWKTVEEPWFPRQKAGQRVAIWRPAGMTHRQQVVAITRARQFVGKTYGWWKLLAHLADNKLFGGRLVVRRALHVDNRPICSYTVATSYAVAGIRTGYVPARAQSPDSIWDYVTQSPDWFEVGRGEVMKEVA